MFGELQNVLEDISEVMARVSEGDLRKRVEVVTRGNLAEIKLNINSSLDKLSHTLSSITGDIHQVANSASQASAAIGQLADGAQTQANSLKQLAVAVQQSSQAVAQIAAQTNMLCL